MITKCTFLSNSFVLIEYSNFVGRRSCFRCDLVKIQWVDVDLCLSLSMLKWKIGKLSGNFGNRSNICSKFRCYWHWRWALNGRFWSEADAFLNYKIIVGIEIKTKGILGSIFLLSLQSRFAHHHLDYVRYSSLTHTFFLVYCPLFNTPHVLMRCIREPLATWGTATTTSNENVALSSSSMLNWMQPQPQPARTLNSIQ